MYKPLEICHEVFLISSYCTGYYTRQWNICTHVGIERKKIYTGHSQHTLRKGTTVHAETESGPHWFRPREEAQKSTPASVRALRYIACRAAGMQSVAHLVLAGFAEFTERGLQSRRCSRGDALVDRWMCQQHLNFLPLGPISPNLLHWIHCYKVLAKHFNSWIGLLTLKQSFSIQLFGSKAKPYLPTFNLFHIEQQKTASSRTSSRAHSHISTFRPLCCQTSKKNFKCIMFSGGVDTRPNNKDLSTTSTPPTRPKGSKGLLSRLLLPLSGKSTAPNPLKRKSCPPLGHTPNAAAAGSVFSGDNQATVQEQAEKPAAPGAQASQISKDSIWLGYARDLSAHYQLGPELGKGGNGTVRHCVEVPVRATTQNSYACKTVPKVPKDPQKTAKHLENLKREIGVLMRLQGSLNIIKLEAVFEDEDSVHIIMENCRGGELANAISKRHYSERTAASYIRAVLRTLAQCHAHNVLHRDIKPGNFMLLNEDERAPVKAIDFGLAVPFEKEDLPLSLGLEGTPWFMAPEALASEYYPASDVWSAGVMAHQLLTGKLPFDDKRNPMNPSLTALLSGTAKLKLPFDEKRNPMNPSLTAEW
ncbi:kinase-like domain-containing protein [Dunaliella salina]|uniref:Kinase-like domain-containing protein n=1 Tax=Dunaliella salina TaxID=3046 RepID=A0ABQ7GY92_DUNSA|nr:kinase-like domain-containing protein [Dunaliella salina]|eukprot:KAF5839572.1 kinase-like domain-containing protein [Dunaliella salina]